MRSPHRPATGLLAGIAALCLVAVLAALLTQHLWGMMPCPWCVLQRLVFLLVGAAALLGVLWQSRTGQRVASAGVLLTALAGAAAALWQHFVAAAGAALRILELCAFRADRWHGRLAAGQAVALKPGDRREVAR